MSNDFGAQMARGAVRRSPLLMVTVAGAVTLVLLIGLAIVGISSDGKQGSSSKPNVSCVEGSGLRAGAVPNGWDADVYAASQVSGIPAPMIAAQIETESSWNPNAEGPQTKYGTAKGLGQFIDSTWAEYGEGDPFDPKAAIAALGKYMAGLMTSMEQIAAASGQDKIVLALAGYNAGPGAVAEAHGVPPFKETQNYVAKIPELAQTKFAGDCQAQPGGGGGEVVIAVGPGEWASPLPGGILTSTFGMRWGAFHAGLDLSIAGGVVTAPVELTITHAGDKGDGYGTSVVGRTTDGSDIQMRFAHCVAGSNTVNVGDTAAAGTKLCMMGMTGDSTGPHLHFEIYKPGVSQNAYHSGCGCAVDPLPVLASKGLQF